MRASVVRLVRINENKILIVIMIKILSMWFN